MPEDDDAPVLSTLAEMTAASLENCDLPAHELVIARLAALVAVDAPAASYLFNLGAAEDVGLTLEDAQGVLVAVAPVVGAPKVISAAANIAKALGFAIEFAADLEELEELDEALEDE